MNYEDYIIKFFNYMYLNFSNVNNNEEILNKYNQLLIDYPNYYTICNNNKNFLFIDGFIYTKNFLNLIEEKDGLNFMGGKDKNSHLTYHFYNEFQTINVQIKSYLLKNKTNDLDCNIFLDKIEQKLINYNIYNMFNITESYINTKEEKTNIYNLLLDYLLLNKEKNIDWVITLDIWFNKIYKIKSKEHKEDIKNNIYKNLINLIIQIPLHKIEDKKDILNFIEKLYPENIDWSKKIDNEYLGYYFFKTMMDKSYEIENDPELIEKWKEFFNYVIYEKILKSGFSFYNNYANSENSLYYFIENFWKNSSGLVAKKEYEILLKNGPVLEEKIKIENKVENKNLNIKYKINKL